MHTIFLLKPCLLFFQYSNSYEKYTFLAGNKERLKRRKRVDLAITLTRLHGCFFGEKKRMVCVFVCVRSFVSPAFVCVYESRESNLLLLASSSFTSYCNMVISYTHAHAHTNTAINVGLT